MAKQYYYFIAGLPGISLDDTKLSYTPEQFRDDALAQLSDEDYALLMLLHLPEDIQNLLGSLYKDDRDPDPEGIYTREFWEEYRLYLLARVENKDLAVPSQFSGLPPFVTTILVNALSSEDMPPRERVEHELLSAFFTFTEKHQNSFISKWFELQREIKNILAAINARHHNMDFAQYLIGDDEDVQNLAKSHAADFGLGKDHAVFDSIMRIWEQNNILYRERGYDIFRAKWIDQQNFFEYFNIDRILGYYSKLRLINRWLKADADLGKEVFHDTLDKLENSFNFPEDFNIKIKQK
ncbi:MAG TPA: DUF2764 family protein [Candidatus Cloacimonadota bacterium]|nr:DUF2764 family protein [Candidatus Cloacimonadota bacterium]